MTVTHLHSRRFRRAGARRRQGRQGDRGRDSRRAASMRRSCATARAALYWLEPMVEVETPNGRIAYGPVEATRRAVAVRRRFPRPAARIALSLGETEEIPFLARQTRLTFARCGITDPLSLDDYEAHGGLRGLRERRRDDAADIVAAGHRIRPARPRRRGLPDRHQVEDGARYARATANTSSATPTRATAAPSPTA